MLLVGRHDEIEALTELLAEAERGSGGVAVVRGGIACGKTALLHGFAARAEATGALFLAATGSRAEHALPLGVISQVLHDAPLPAEDAVRIADLLGDAERANGPTGDVGAHVVHDLGRVLLGLTERRTVVIGIDDVEYVDRASLRCLLFLIWRIRSARMLIVFTKCVVPEPPLVFEIEVLRQPRCRHVALSPLTRDIVRDMLSALLNEEVARRCADGAYAVTGGNPLLVHALAEDHLTASPVGTGHTADRLVPGEAFQRAVFGCLHSRAPDLMRIARAIAVLDGLASASTVGRLLGLEPQAVERAVAALTAAGLLESYGFRHPAARAAVLRDLSTSGDADLHRRAAAFLYGDGAPALVVADLLVLAGTVDGPWAIPVLLQAAEQTLVSGQASTAVEYLRLARLAGGDEEQRIAVTAKLARAEWRLDPAVAVRHLDVLTCALRRGALRGRHASMPIRHLLWQGRIAEALGVLDALTEIADQLDPVTLAELRSAQLWVGLSYPPFGAASPTPNQEQDPEWVASSPLTVVLGRRRGGPAGIDAAHRILQRERLDDATLGSTIAGLVTLMCAGRADEADACCESLLEEAIARGAPTWQALFLGIRSEIAVRRDDLQLAEAYAREALSILPSHSWGVAIGRPLASLILALTFQGAYEDAAELLAVPMPNPMFDTRVGLHYLYARGHYYLAAGRPSAALGNFRACADLMAKCGLDQPAVVPRVDAREWRTRGISLSQVAETSDLDQRAKLLAHAVDVLRDSGDRLPVAHALADLGLMCQAMGEAERAQGLLRQALEMAEACHAGPRPRRLAAATLGESTDVCGLSDAERHVATLAAEGHTNREIARRLSITTSTVEQHLTRVYRKLKVTRRWDLPKRLSAVGAADLR